MIVVYRSRPSNSARALVEMLPNCRRALNLDRRAPVRGDYVVCWGEELENGRYNGINILNGTHLINKYEAAVRLREAGVPTVEVSRTRPTNVAERILPRGNFDLSNYADSLTETSAADLRRAIDTYLNRPLTRVAGSIWLPRTSHHVGGSDLLNPPREPNYYSKKEDLIEEYRIHCFKGRSIRAGRKVQGVEGVNGSHEWIRSLDSGWRLSYDGFSSTKEQRKLAKEALEALDLDFGAVDIGKKRDNSLVVLEVNRAPGLEGNTINVYADAIQRWTRGERDED